MGKSVGKKGVVNFINSSDNYWLKSLLVNHNVINDKYVSDKIYDNIVNKIKSACMGKLVVNGNYQRHQIQQSSRVFIKMIWL